MVREVLTLNVGKAGIQLSQCLWNQYNTEHNINYYGKIINYSNTSNDNSFTTFYHETNTGQFEPRNLSIDTESDIIDTIKTSQLSKIFNHENLISGKEDASNIFARGYYTVGKEIIDLVAERIRKLIENCDNFQGFFINHSIAGGTGSGLGALIEEKLAFRYRKKSKITFNILPSNYSSNNVLDSYNSVLTTHWESDCTEFTFLLDNEALYNICHNKLGIKKPSYDNMNKIMAKVISGMTTSLRFESDINKDLYELQMNLIQYPRLRHLIGSIAPIVSKSNKNVIKCDIETITNNCLNPTNWLLKMNDFNISEDKYMSIILNYRGNNIERNKSTIQNLKSNNVVSFEELSPIGFKININSTPLKSIENDNMASFNKNVISILNNVCIRRLFSDRMCKSFDLLYSQKSFVHWYTKEGMEQEQFNESREDLAFLERDYLDIAYP